MESMEQIVQAVMRRIFVELEASGRHVHVTQQQALELFGHPLTPKRPLSQPGQYLAQERVTVVGPKGEFRNVAVLGPARKAAQVEISMTDGHQLGLQPPIRPSGDITKSPGVVLIGPNGRVELQEGVIVAQRHVHMTPEDARQRNVQDGQVVRLQAFTDRPVIFEDVLVRVSPEFATYAHLDFDEANACALQKGDLGRILP